MTGRANPVADDARPIPDGFAPIELPQPFLWKNGPLYWRRQDDRVNLGMYVAHENCNPRGVCHGGWLASVMDAQLPFSGLAALGLGRTPVATVSMTLDYLAAAPMGCWLEGSATLLRRTGRMMFLQGMLSADGVPVLRGSGVWRIFDQKA